RPLSLPFPLIFLLLLTCIFAIISIVIATFIGLIPTETRITILSLVPLVHSFQFIVISIICFILFRVLKAIGDLDRRLILIEVKQRIDGVEGYTNPNHLKGSQESFSSPVCEAPGVIFR
ncbi:hypothetical protein PENTCL1PPCAC_4390, partial [Pristionchus entomophagus]